MDVNLSQATLAAASSDFCIKLADTQSMQQVSVLSGHTGPVLAVKFGPRGKYLVRILFNVRIGIDVSLEISKSNTSPSTMDCVYPLTLHEDRAQ